MDNKKKPAKRGKYKKSSIHWKTKLKLEREQGNAPLPQQDNRDLLAVLLTGIDRLNIGDKARVLTHILGKDQIDEKQLSAIQKMLT